MKSVESEIKRAKNELILWVMGMAAWQTIFILNVVLVAKFLLRK